MRTLLTLLLCALPVCAQVLPTARAIATPTPAAATGGLAGDILEETFEANEYDNTWTELFSQNPNGNTSTSGLGLQGAECVYLDGSTTDQGIEFSMGTQAELYVRFRYRPDTIPTYNDANILYFSNTSGGAGTRRFALRFNSNGTLETVATSTASTATVGAMSADTTYYVWFHFRNSDRLCEVGFSTDTTRPTTGDNYTSVNLGTAGTSPAYLELRQDFGSSSGGQGYFDEVYADTTGWPDE